MLTLALIVDPVSNVTFPDMLISNDARFVVLYKDPPD